MTVVTAATTIPAIALLGPTASGKSALALRLCEALGGELISVDSAQVYRGMDIGTAKPTAVERARVAHHLLDIVDPSESYSAARFSRDAASVMADIRARGRVPVLAGGTMLYFRALFCGLSALPAADPALRVGIAARAARDGWPALHAELAGLDPVAAAALHPNDATRIQRALEIVRSTGEPLHVHRQPPARPDHGRLLVVRWQPLQREGLRAAIAKRFEAMMEAGLLEEVRALHARDDLHADLPATRAVGYRQLWQYLDGACELAQAQAIAVKATKGLAKRQTTWLNGGLVEAMVVPGRDAVFNGTEPADAEAVVSWCAKEVHNNGRHKGHVAVCQQ